MGWRNSYKIEEFVVKRIVSESEKTDMIILNEFVVSEGWDYFQKKLNENGYVWFITHTSSKNGILIVVKNGYCLK